MQADSVLRKLPQRIWPVLAVLCAVVVLWYGGAVGLNAPQVTERFERDKIQFTTSQLIEGTWSMKRPLLPAPHQVAADLHQTIFAEAIDTPQNLLYHAFSTAVTTLTGFVLGALLGVFLAVLIVRKCTIKIAKKTPNNAPKTKPVSVVTAVLNAWYNRFCGVSMASTKMVWYKSAATWCGAGNKGRFIDQVPSSSCEVVY